MSATNLANVIGGPALVSYKGSIFRSKADVKLVPSLASFEISTDLYGPVDTRAGNQEVKITLTPEGRFADLDVLFPDLDAGDMVTPIHACGAVVFAANTIAVADTSLAVGTPVSFGTTGTMPGGLTAATVYYLGLNVGGLRLIYPTSADALAATNVIDLTDNGTGELNFVEQWPLVILGKDGRKYTFHNAAVTKMPTINAKSKETLWGEVEFEAFCKNGVDRTTANSVLTESTAAFADAGFNPADLITQKYSLTWGAAPWAGIYSKAGIVIEPSMDLAVVEDENSGILSRRITKRSFTAKAQPMGITFAALLAKLNLDGAGAVAGRSLVGDDLDIEGTGVFMRLTAASLNGSVAQWKSDLERTGELTWGANRTFTAGAPNPLFFIGTAAP